MQIVLKIEGGGTKSITIDEKALEAQLRAAVQGEVRFDGGTRALYATAAGNYRQVPIGVVLPRTNLDVVEAIAICRRYGAPVLMRGGGTSLAGQTCNVAVVLDISKYLRDIVKLDPGSKSARVQPGVVLDDLRNAAEQYHLTFAPDPSTHTHCTLGGMIGNNSCGVHSVMGGKTVDNVESMRVLTYDGLELEVGKTSDDELESIIRAGGRRGEIYYKLKTLRDKYADLIRQRFPKIPRRVSGYNLDQLLPENGFNVARALVGSEGTCVVVLEATVHLVYSPPKRSLLVLGYPDVYSAGDHVTQILAFGPIGLEGFDDRLIDDIKKKHKATDDLALLPKGGGWLVVEFGGESREQSDAQARKAMEELKKLSDPPDMRLYDDKQQEERLRELRESGLGATAFVPAAPLTWEGWEDSAVPPEKLGNYLRDFRKLLDKYKYGCDLYGHFGQGCVHTRIDFDLESQPGIEKYRAFTREAAGLVAHFGGSLSGEHGDGQSRAELLAIMFGNELVDAFQEFKRIWDPEWKMNPGKIVDPYRRDENLRLGAQYQPWRPQTHFKFPDDSWTVSRAVLRCVGIGNCRREEGGTMCPSYMVTHEERHSTRGRSRLLFEMLRGEVIQGGWREGSVLEALDLCLSCKGCKGDCPVNVDMATYKAEFLSHYYQGKLRPRHAYAIGYIHRWARLAAHFPRTINFFAQAPVLGSMAKFAAGISRHRRMPPFADEPFKNWFKRHRGLHSGYERNVRDTPTKTEVILWADTFNNYFHPGTAQAAVEVLESAGCRIRVPRQNLCCGRPLYDYGMLDSAKRLLIEILETLRAPIRAGVPVVVLEPSCAAVFRDELMNFFPNDEDAKRLSQQTFLLSEFLEKRIEDYQPPPMNRKAIVHGHCHHRAVMKMDAEEKVLKKLGLDFQLLDSGCCGMAGGFGFEKDHYDISIQVGERVLLPAVRQADPETLIIANGFSCREQISQTTDRKALHLAEVIQMAMRGEGSGAGDHRRSIAKQGRVRAAAVGLAAGAMLLGGGLLWAVMRRRT
ncbi:MAG TPA: FAD-binding and (Fe-S)-binding domain-containing protein [Terriglobia bacterium]|nr:FAD-binding and (Fe-S)-binding domain-containing protein [Terriglobia bacterium]